MLGWSSSSPSRFNPPPAAGPGETRTPAGGSCNNAVSIRRELSRRATSKERKRSSLGGRHVARTAGVGIPRGFKPRRRKSRAEPFFTLEKVFHTLFSFAASWSSRPASLTAYCSMGRASGPGVGPDGLSLAPVSPLVLVANRSCLRAKGPRNLRTLFQEEFALCSLYQGRSWKMVHSQLHSDSPEGRIFPLPCLQLLLGGGTIISTWVGDLGKRTFAASSILHRTELLAADPA